MKRSRHWSFSSWSSESLFLILLYIVSFPLVDTAHQSVTLLSRYYGLYDGDSREKLLEAYSDSVSWAVLIQLLQ